MKHVRHYIVPLAPAYLSTREAGFPSRLDFDITFETDSSGCWRVADNAKNTDVLRHALVGCGTEAAFKLAALAVNDAARGLPVYAGFLIDTHTCTEVTL